MPTTESPPTAFESLAALRQEHLRLLRQTRESGGAAAAQADMGTFLDRAEALGARLDAAADREAAQGILDYWTAALLTAAGGGRPRQAPPRALAEFDAGTVRQAAAAAERTVAARAPEDQELARRVFLRLVRLVPDGHAFEPVEVRRVDLEAVGDPARVRPLLADLEQAGVFRVTPTDTGPTYALRSEALTRVWPRYATWLDKRARFRDQVQYWEKNDRGRGALISGPLLSDALIYHDLSGTEKEYLDRSRQRESRLKHVWQAVTVVAVLLMLGAIAGWVTALKHYREAVDALSKKDEALGEKEQALVKEKEALAKAQKARRDLAEHNATRARKDVLQNMSGLIQSLARGILAGENEAEYDRVQRRWEVLLPRKAALINGLRKAEDEAGAVEVPGAPDDQLVRDVEELYGDFPNGPIPKQPGNPRDLALRPLQLGQRVKAKMEERGDPVFREELRRMRDDTFNYARTCTKEIVTRVGRRDYETASQYIKEFWVLYWGDMGLLEGPVVSAAMSRFGQQLGEIDDLFRDWSGWKDAKKGPPRPFWQQMLKSRDGAKYKDDPEYEKRFKEAVQELQDRKRALDAALDAEQGKAGKAAPLTAY